MQNYLPTDWVSWGCFWSIRGLSIFDYKKMIIKYRKCARLYGDCWACDLCFLLTKELFLSSFLMRGATCCFLILATLFTLDCLNCKDFLITSFLIPYFGLFLFIWCETFLLLCQSSKWFNNNYIFLKKWRNYMPSLQSCVQGKMRGKQQNNKDRHSKADWLNVFWMWMFCICSSRGNHRRYELYPHTVWYCKIVVL